MINAFTDQTLTGAPDVLALPRGRGGTTERRRRRTVKNKTVRIKVRVTSEIGARIEKAAAWRGMSVDAFVLEAAIDRADQVLDHWQTTVVSAEYFDRLLAALDEPISS